MTVLKPNDLQRYDRQIMIEEIGEKGQEKLKKARIFIAGAGGLGSSISIYLAAAGVGTIRIVDNDTVDISNLNRQILYRDSDIGKKKTDACMEKLALLNQSIHIETLCETITEKNISSVGNPQGEDRENRTEWAKDLGRKRGDLFEIAVWKDGVHMVGDTLYYYQAIHQESDVIPENIDCIRAMCELESDRWKSIKKTNLALSIK